MKKPYKETNKLKVTCANCKKEKNLLIITIERSKKKNNGNYICASCKAKTAIKPQCSKDYWTTDKRIEQGLIVKNSEKHKESRKNLNNFGPANPMFGKKHSEATKNKMSAVRIGKVGINATAWKGGKTSLTKRVKRILHTRHNWYKLVYQRDNYKCVKCSSKKKIDAHHIKPVWKIIKELLKNKIFSSEEEKLEWLVEHPELKDSELKNGLTLCRECHKIEHGNWGSHYVR